LNLTPIIMDLKAKIYELHKELANKAIEKERLHLQMKEIKKKISKYETVLKHAEEIESVEEKQPV
jgi:chromosome segregation ATPase